MIPLILDNNHNSSMLTEKSCSLSTLTSQSPGSVAVGGGKDMEDRQVEKSRGNCFIDKEKFDGFGEVFTELDNTGYAIGLRNIN